MTDPLVLSIDASTYSGSVAVVSGGVVLAEQTVAMRGEQAERLLPGVRAALREAGVEQGALGRVICGAGPGSFTSLRIAASIAKGLCFALGIPLLAVPSPWLMIAGGSLPAGRYVSALDAMRGDAFAQAFEVLETGGVETISELVLRPATEIDAIAAELGAAVAGPGRSIELWPHARGAALLGGSPNVASEVSIDRWEPDYGRLAEAQVKWEAAHGRPLPRG